MGEGERTAQAENLTGATAEKRTRYLSSCFEFFQLSEQEDLSISGKNCVFPDSNGEWPGLQELRCPDISKPTSSLTMYC